MDEPSRFGQFFRELKRRHVVRAFIAYAAVAFVVLQAAEIVNEAFALPPWGLRLVIVFALLGLPPVLALAWVYELTPHGLRTMRELDAEAGIEERGKLLPRVAFAAITIVTFGGAGWWWASTRMGTDTPAGSEPPASTFRPASTTEATPVHSLAVLPFESFSEDGERDYFVEGMQEALISQLSQLDFVRVISRTSVNQYDGSGKSAAQIGEELGVDALVEGSVFRAEGRVRITVQLIHAASDQHLWSRDYEREFVDVIALQREVAEAISEELRGELTPLPSETLASSTQARTADPEAADEVLRGRVALADAVDGEIALDSVEAHFNRAVAEDPGFAPAYSGIAQTRVLRGLASAGLEREEALRSALEAARRAVELDPGNREAHEVLVQVGALVAGSALESSFEETIEIEVPDLDSIGLGFDLDGAAFIPALTEAGRQIQILVARREADGAAPEARVLSARRLQSLGRNDQAVTVLEDVLRSDPDNEMAWEELERIARLEGDFERVLEVRSEREEALGPDPSAPSLEELAQALEARGPSGYWTWRLAELEAREAAGDPVSRVELATAHAALGHQERALELLEDAAEARDPRLLSIRADPIWDPFRRRHRFRQALSEVMFLRRPPRPPGG